MIFDVLPVVDKSGGNLVNTKYRDTSSNIQELK